MKKKKQVGVPVMPSCLFLFVNNFLTRYFCIDYHYNHNVLLFIKTLNYFLYLLFFLYIYGNFDSKHFLFLFHSIFYFKTFFLKDCRRYVCSINVFIAFIIFLLYIRISLRYQQLRFQSNFIMLLLIKLISIQYIWYKGT